MAANESKRKKEKKVPDMLKKPFSPGLKKSIVAPSYSWKFSLTKVREIRAVEVGSVFFGRDIKNLQVSPASSVYRDWEKEGLPMDRVPERRKKK